MLYGKLVVQLGSWKSTRHTPRPWTTWPSEVLRNRHLQSLGSIFEEKYLARVFKHSLEVQGSPSRVVYDFKEFSKNFQAEIGEFPIKIRAISKEILFKWNFLGPENPRAGREVKNLGYMSNFSYPFKTDLS